MQGDRLQQAETIFAAIVNAPRERRSALLAERCGDDPALHAFVERLLRHHDTGGGGVVDPPVAVGAAGAPDSVGASIAADLPGAGATVAALGTAGRTLGHYVLRERLGAGGMGEVWRAEQTAPIRRTVALKLIKAGMDSEQVIARFESERQALALMDHPAIARVIDGGTTPEGRPYFVMEHVPGIPITEYCDRRRLETRERLALFVRVCEGVQHAHQKAVIHRDLKPSNILVSEVDGRPQPKIIDFGVAKATTQKLTERTMYTALGQIVGTPAYMSPEQAELSGLDVDTRTDVYALGVLLYELLTGTLPFETTTLREAGLDAMRRIIREEEPPRPSTRISSLGEAVREAAARRRTDPVRWRKALRRELDWITMKAMEKDRNRRYESASAMAADIGRYLADQPLAAGPPSTVYRLQKYVKRHRVGVGVAALLGLAVILGYIQTTVQNARIAAARDEAVLAIDSLEEMLASVDPTKRGRDVTVRETLDATARTLGEKFRDQPLVEAQLRHTLGKTYRALGEFKEAEEHLRRAVTIRTERLGVEDPATLEARNDLVRALQDLARYDEAEALALETLETAHRALGDEHLQTLEAMGRLGGVYWQQSRLDEAEPLLRQTLETQRRVLGEEHPSSLFNMMTLANVCSDQGRSEEAEALRRETLKIQRRVLGEEHPLTLGTMSNLAAGYLDQGRYQEAAALQRELRAIQLRVLGEDHPFTLINTMNLALSCQRMVRYDEADSLFRSTLEGQRRVLGEEHPATLLTMQNLAILRLAQGRSQEAATIHQEASAISRRVFGDEDPTTVHSLFSLGWLYCRLGRPEEAYALDRQTLEMSRRVLGEGDQQTHLLRYNLACHAALLGHRDSAISYLRDAMDHGYRPSNWAAIPDDPELASLVGDPEFEAIMKELKRRSEEGTASETVTGTE